MSQENTESQVEELRKALSAGRGDEKPIKVQFLFGEGAPLGNPEWVCDNCREEAAILVYDKEARKRLCDKCDEAYHTKDNGETYTERGVMRGIPVLSPESKSDQQKPS